MVQTLLAVAAVFAACRASLLPSHDATLACEAINALYPGFVAWPPLDLVHFTPATLNFTYTTTHYWNGGNGQLVPACVFYPSSGEQVAGAVQTLKKYESVPWAVKAGGHNPNKGFSSVAGGVLISFRPFMQSTTLSADKSYADNEAVSALSSAGKALVGGRLGDVGVGGYTLGGGLSFLSAQYGFACDMVLSYEAVLANGTLVTVSDSENPDLFYALKGGGNQFAVVTSFRMLTVPIGPVWGGIKIYSGDDSAAIINATHDFSIDYDDPKAAVIVTYETLLDTLANVYFVFFFYNDPSPPASVFAKFNAITPLIDNTKVQSYADLLDSNDIGNIYGFNYLIRAQTIPLIPGDDGKSLMQYQHDSFKDYATATQAQNLDLMIYSFAFQPMSRIIQAASNKQGDAVGQRNALGLNPDDGDRIWMEYDISWINPLDETRAHMYADHIGDDIVGYIATHYPGVVSNGQKNDASNIAPNFFNDGMSDQATSLFFHDADYQKLKTIQGQRDPQGFFSKRTGGFKFT